jgi:hypothetical protein
VLSTCHYRVLSLSVDVVDEVRDRASEILARREEVEGPHPDECPTCRALLRREAREARATGTFGALRIRRSIWPDGWAEDPTVPNLWGLHALTDHTADAPGRVHRRVGDLTPPSEN